MFDRDKLTTLWQEIERAFREDDALGLIIPSQDKDKLLQLITEALDLDDASDGQGIPYALHVAIAEQASKIEYKRFLLHAQTEKVNLFDQLQTFYEKQLSTVPEGFLNTFKQSFDEYCHQLSGETAQQKEVVGLTVGLGKSHALIKAIEALPYPEGEKGVAQHHWQAKKIIEKYFDTLYKESEDIDDEITETLYDNMSEHALEIVERIQGYINEKQTEIVDFLMRNETLTGRVNELFTHINENKRQNTLTLRDEFGEEKMDADKEWRTLKRGDDLRIENIKPIEHAIEEACGACIGDWLEQQGIEDPSIIENLHLERCFKYYRATAEDRFNGKTKKPPTEEETLKRLHEMRQSFEETTLLNASNQLKKILRLVDASALKGLTYKDLEKMPHLSTKEQHLLNTALALKDLIVGAEREVFLSADNPLDASSLTKYAETFPPETREQINYISAHLETFELLLPELKTVKPKPSANVTAFFTPCEERLPLILDVKMKALIKLKGKKFERMAGSFLKKHTPEEIAQVLFHPSMVEKKIDLSILVLLNENKDIRTLVSHHLLDDVYTGEERESILLDEKIQPIKGRVETEIAEGVTLGMEAILTKTDYGSEEDEDWEKSIASKHGK